MNTALHMTDPKSKPKKEGDVENQEEEPGILKMALLNKGSGPNGIALSHLAGTCLTSEVT